MGAGLSQNTINVPTHPKTSQADYSRLLQGLGVRSEPDAGMVVHHLIHCVENGLEVNEEIYTFLNRCAADPRVRSLQQYGSRFSSDHGPIGMGTEFDSS